MYNPKILVVDDGLGHQKLVKKSLKIAGYENVHIFGDGSEVINQYVIENSEIADLILSDTDMPRMGGLEMAAKLKSKGYEVPIIGMSAFPSKERKKEWIQVGAISFLDKSQIFSDEFLYIVDQAIGYLKDKKCNLYK